MSTTAPAAIPVPDRTTRDELGRLVAASWRGAAAGDGPGSRWLVAVDGSQGSLRAASAAARLVASEAGAGVDLVHVHPWLVKEAAESELPRRAWHATDSVRALMDDAGIAWRLHVRMGNAADEIVELARKLGSRGIAIGSHGLTATASLLLGSVTHEVVRLATVPVLIVR